MIFICSRGRRNLLEMFFKVSQPKLEGRVLIDDDDPSYKGMTLPLGWEFEVGQRDSTSRILNRAFENHPNEPYYGVICDDMIYIEPNPGWDGLLAGACTPKYLAWGNDGRFQEKLCPSFFVGGDLVRLMGWLVHPEIGHLYGDTVWWMISRGSKLSKYLPEVQYRHNKVMDRTFLERRIQGDASTFERLRLEEIPQLTHKAFKFGHPVNQS
jgi:hypothetical protein